MDHFYGFDGEPITREQWWALFADNDGRRIGATQIGDGVSVSTVWMGIDHNFSDEGAPLIFETMIFGGRYDQWQWRYATREAALAGHDQAVALARDPVARV